MNCMYFVHARGSIRYETRMALNVRHAYSLLPHWYLFAQRAAARYRKVSLCPLVETATRKHRGQEPRSDGRMKRQIR